MFFLYQRNNIFSRKVCNTMVYFRDDELHTRNKCKPPENKQNKINMKTYVGIYTKKKEIVYCYSKNSFISVIYRTSRYTRTH